MLKTYISTLKAETEAVIRQRQADQSLHLRRPAGVKPLTVQIEELMRSLSPALRDRAWTMDDLVGRLQGSYRNRPHAANVGQALRALGWVRVRDWSAAGGGRRVWYKSRDR
jgi:hypothetical protein